MKSAALLLIAIGAALPAQSQTDPPVQHIQAELSSVIKLSKVKAGDKLKAQTVLSVTLANGTSIPTGSTLLGQVLQADASSLTLTFDQANVDGHKVPLNITLVGAALIGAKAQASGAKENDSKVSAANESGKSSTFTPAHAGSVIGLPGVKLTIDDGPPFASKFEVDAKDPQLPRGVQLMFSVR